MINRSGYTSFTKNSFSPSYAPKAGSKGGNSPLFFGIVSKISFEPVGDSYHEVGLIEFSDYAGNVIGEALPIFSNSSFKYPIEGEVVMIVRNTSLNEEGRNNSNFYFPSLNLWSNPNSNTTSQINSLFPGNSYPPYVKSNIHPLFPYTLDNIIQGGFGNSIRLGSTNKEESIPNNWSSTGEDYSPIMILMNGQDPTNTNLGYIPTTENINNDLSSIYLTSTQQIPFTLTKEDFVSYTTPPTTPSQYASPQILFNSDRIILNAKKDSILISSQKSVGLFSNESINLESKQIYIDGTDIKLGSKNAEEPLLLGNKTVDTLSQILTQLIGICNLLSVSQIFPGGVPIPDASMNAVASNANSTFLQLQSQLNSLKSNISKTK